MKKRNIFPFVMMIVVSLLITACSGAAPTASSAPEAVSSEATISAPAESVELNVSAAASLTDALTEISKLYAAKAPNVTLVYNFAASGALQTQIEEGAAADLFISAATKQMSALEDKGLVESAGVKNLLVNQVVMIVPANSSLNLSRFEDCAGNQVKMVAIGNPESVPAGQYAKEIFTKLGIWDKVQAKANQATNVREVLSWVETGNADCGIVYSTDAKTSAGVKIVATAPEDSHAPVVYPAAVLKASKHSSEAQAFLDYLSSEEAKQVFVKAGFSVGE